MSSWTAHPTTAATWNSWCHHVLDDMLYNICNKTSLEIERSIVHRMCVLYLLFTLLKIDICNREISTLASDAFNKFFRRQQIKFLKITLAVVKNHPISWWIPKLASYFSRCNRITRNCAKFPYNHGWFTYSLSLRKAYYTVINTQIRMSQSGAYVANRKSFRFAIPLTPQ